MIRLDFDGLDGSLVLPANKHSTDQPSALEHGQDGDQAADAKATGLTAYTESSPLTARRSERTEKIKDTGHLDQSDDSLYYDDTVPLLFETAASNRNIHSRKESLLLQRLTKATKANHKTRTESELNRDIADDPVVPTLKDKVASEPTPAHHLPPPPNSVRQRVKRLITIAAVFMVGLLLGGASLLAWLNLGNEFPRLSLFDKSPAPAMQRATPVTPPELAEHASAAASHAPIEHAENDIAPISGGERAFETFESAGDGGASQPSNLQTQNNLGTDRIPADQSAGDFQPPGRSGTDEQFALQTQDNLETGRRRLDQAPDHSSPPPESTQDDIEGYEHEASLQQLAQEVVQKALPPDLDAQTTTWTIPFLFNSIDVSKGAVEKLKDSLLLCDKEIFITGHTCSLGDPDKNYYVGLERAKSVRERLTALGFPSERLKVDSAGANRPVATNATEEGRRVNRRVVISCRQE